MTAEQQARDMLERIGVENAQSFTAGDLVELANLIAELDHLAHVIEHISTADDGGNEIYPTGPSDREFAEDGNTLIRNVGPWKFRYGIGDTFMAAVEDDMRKSQRRKD